MPVLNIIIVILWVSCAVLYVAIRIRMKKVAPDKHDEIFGKYLSEHSVQKSLSFIRVALSSKKWKDFSDSRLVGLLRINRLLFVAFSVILLGQIVYFFVFGLLRAINA